MYRYLIVLAVKEIIRTMFMVPAYVGIILVKNKEVFLVKRRNTDWASGQWNFPGGLLEKDETLAQAAVREAFEEMGVVLNPASLELVHVIHIQASAANANDIIGFYFAAREWQGTPFNKEPHRHEQAGWFSMNALPENSTTHALQALSGFLSGAHYSEN